MPSKLFLSLLQVLSYRGNEGDDKGDNGKEHGNYYLEFIGLS